MDSSVIKRAAQPAQTKRQTPAVTQVPVVERKNMKS